MNITVVLAAGLLVFAAVKTSIFVDEELIELPATDFPDFAVPFNAVWDPQFTNVSSGLLPWLTGDNVAVAIGNVIEFLIESFEIVLAAIVWLFLQLWNIIQLAVLLIQWAIFFLALLLTPIPDAPFIINFIMLMFPLVGIILIIGLSRGTAVS